MRKKLNPPNDVSKLAGTIELIDALSQEILTSIGAVAHLARKAAEAKGSVNDEQAVRQALGLIEYMAGDLMERIDNEAERVRCNHVEANHAQA
ncbi:MAG: hypothetical protein EPO12_12395 [Aquabacterium sp.]|nr:MAG: hypothetical protein EPO12_12395 [Aquabacterium sp.]